MSYFREARNVELSLLYFFETNLATDWPGVTLVKAFLDAYDSNPPVISVGISVTGHNRKEIGSTALFNNYIFDVDIMARSDGQRIDLASWVVDTVLNGCTYYTHSHNSGDSSILDRVSAGKIHVLDIAENSHLFFGEESTDVHDKYRQFISLIVRKDI